MKKIGLAVAGLVVVIGVGLLIGRPEGSGKPDGLKKTRETPRLGTGQVEQVAEIDGSDVEQTSLSAQRQAGMPAPLELSDAVKALVGLDGKEHNYSSLLAAISELDYELSDTDVVALREMLTWPNDRFPEKMKPIGINAIKNDVLDKLLRQKELPAGLGLQMVYTSRSVWEVAERAAIAAENAADPDFLEYVNEADWIAEYEKDISYGQ